MVETGQIPDSKTVDWNQHAAASAKWRGAPFEGLARGTRDVSDPRYAHLVD